MTPDPKLTAQQARERARKASEYVMALRALLGPGDAGRTRGE
jgi:hypothetical protein